MSPFYFHRRRVAFHETDAMAVVHHSNYVRYFEEARVAWLRDRGFIGIHHPYGNLVFAVLDMRTRFYKPAKFDQEFAIAVQSRLIKLRLEFRYALYLRGPGDLVEVGESRTVNESRAFNVFASEGTTELVPLDQNLRPTRLPETLREHYLSEPWSDAWPKELTGS